MAEYFPQYEAWLQQYEELKDLCDIPGSVAFCQQHPGAINNRKNNLQGNSMLHQIAFWGVTRDVVEQFMQMGSDPTLRNFKGETALDMAVSEGHGHTAEAFVDVFGNSDDWERLKSNILSLAKSGDFVTCLVTLKDYPWLRNVQGNSGWSVLHQAAFHGCGSRLLARLLNIGVSEDLLTHDGETFLDVLGREHPSHAFLTNPESAPRLEEGSPVSILAGAERLRGTVQTISADTVQVLLDSGEVEEHPRWRASPVVDVVLQDVDDTLGMHCLSCTCPIPLGWTVGADCRGEPHGLCYECRNTWLYSHLTAMKPKLECAQCHAECSVEHLRALRTRGTEASWERQKHEEFGITMSYLQFLEALENRMSEMQDVEARVRYNKSIIDTDQVTPTPLAYCEVAGAPAYRVCAGCASVIEYRSDCKHMTCSCGYSFCWLCLKTEDEHAAGEWHFGHPCRIAPIQSEDAVREIVTRTLG